MKMHTSSYSYALWWYGISALHVCNVRPEEFVTKMDTLTTVKSRPGRPKETINTPDSGELYTGTCAVPGDSRDSVPSIHPSHCNQGLHRAKWKMLAHHGELVCEGSGIVRSTGCRGRGQNYRMDNGQATGICGSAINATRA